MQRIVKQIIVSVLLSVSSVAQADLSSQLESNSKAVSAKIASSVSAQQSKFDRRLKIQLQIDGLRTKMGATTDPQLKQSLGTQIQQLQSQLRKIK